MNSFVTGRCKRVTAILCICFLLIQSLGCGKSVVAKRSIVAEDLTGVVHAEREDKSREVVKGEKMESGDYVTVMQDSSLTLLLDKDKHVFADKATFFRLDAVDAGTEISLLGGTLTINIENKLSDGETFEVSTPNAVMAVRGTIFTVTVTQEDGYYTTELSVREGAVEVRTIEDGKEITKMVNPGESVMLEGSAPGSGYVPPVKAAAEESADADSYHELNLDQYDNFGFAHGGVIPVCQGDKWGAVDYEGNVIVPLQYSYYKSPNEKGYSVFMNGQYDETVSYLYDNKGNLITVHNGFMVASSDAYVTTTDVNYGIDDPDNFMWGDYYSTTHSYYRYDGSLITSVDSGFSERHIADPKGFYDGKSVLVGNIKQLVFKRSDIEAGITPFDFGFIDTKGNIEWKDGDGYDDTNTSLFMDYASGVAAQEAEREKQQNNGWGGAGGGGGYNEVDSVISTLNHGYFLTQGVWEEGIGLRNEKGENVAWIMPWTFTIENDGTNDYLNYAANQAQRSGVDTPVWTYSGYGGYDANYYGFWHDGEWVYNYGSKLVVRTPEKSALIDFAVTGGQLKVKIFDYCALADEKYWLISKDAKWGYCDHDGNVVRLFDDAGDFNNGIAPVIHDGQAYIVNEDFEDLKSLGAATGVASSGEMIVVYNGSDKTYYIPE